MRGLRTSMRGLRTSMCGLRTSMRGLRTSRLSKAHPACLVHSVLMLLHNVHSHRLRLLRLLHRQRRHLHSGGKDGCQGLAVRVACQDDGLLPHAAVCCCTYGETCCCVLLHTR
jgi:hypothetical protein